MSIGLDIAELFELHKVAPQQLVESPGQESRALLACWKLLEFVLWVGLLCGCFLIDNLDPKEAFESLLVFPLLPSLWALSRWSATCLDACFLLTPVHMFPKLFLVNLLYIIVRIFRRHRDVSHRDVRIFRLHIQSLHVVLLSVLVDATTGSRCWVQAIGSVHNLWKLFRLRNVEIPAKLSGWAEGEYLGLVCCNLHIILWTTYNTIFIDVNVYIEINVDGTTCTLILLIVIRRQVARSASILPHPKGMLRTVVPIQVLFLQALTPGRESTSLRPTSSSTRSSSILHNAPTILCWLWRLHWLHWVSRHADVARPALFAKVGLDVDCLCHLRGRKLPKWLLSLSSVFSTGMYLLILYIVSALIEFILVLIANRIHKWIRLHEVKSLLGVLSLDLSGHIGDLFIELVEWWRPCRVLWLAGHTFWLSYFFPLFLFHQILAYAFYHLILRSEPGFAAQLKLSVRPSRKVWCPILQYLWLGYTQFCLWLPLGPCAATWPHRILALSGDGSNGPTRLHPLSALSELLAAPDDFVELAIFLECRERGLGLTGAYPRLFWTTACWVGGVFLASAARPCWTEFWAK